MGLDKGVKKDHDYYFNSYSHLGIHEEMLRDMVRTMSYKNAILRNKNQFKDKVVLDIGCGTGILSIFCSRAGAKHVYAVEYAEVSNLAKAIIKDNDLESKITVIKGKMEEVVLPVEKVDIIVSEWMGYCLLYESMLDSVLWARDKYLKKDGLILPDHCKLYMAAIEDQCYKAEKVSFWTNVYGVNMNAVKKSVLYEPIVDNINGTDIMSSICMVKEIDLYTVKKEDLDFSQAYELTLDGHNGIIHGMVIWFDCAFSKMEFE